MPSLFIGFLSLCLAGAEPSSSVVVEGAQLTLIEDSDLSASEAGALTELLVHEGENVQEGQLLARIDDREAALLCESAESELVVARATAENDISTRYAKLAAAVAQAELQRAQESNEKFPKSVSQSEIARLKLLADKAELEIEQAEHQRKLDTLMLRLKEQNLARARLVLERRQLKAPFSGMVVRVNQHRGEWVEPGTSVLRVIRLDRLRVEAFLQTDAAPSELIGRPVTVAASGDKPSIAKQAGTLVFVSPEVDPVNGQVRVWAEIDNHDQQLRPGQSVTMTISSNTSADTPSLLPSR